MLRSSGYYFSGVFESTAAEVNFTDTYSTVSKNEVYIFATGNWLNFIKLVEDYQIESTFAAHKKDWTYGFQRDVAWKYFCYKPSANNEPPWKTTTLLNPILPYATEYVFPNSYPNSNPAGYNPERGTITPPANSKQVKIKFTYIDTDYGASNTSGDREKADYVRIIGDNVTLFDVGGEDIEPNSKNANVRYNGSNNWNTGVSFLDAEGYTPPINAKSIKIRFINNSSYSNTGHQRGFKITGYKFVETGEGEPGDYSCTNGLDGFGQKIKSRIDVAKKAMINAVSLTEDTISWGVSKFNSANGALEIAPLGTSPKTVVSALENLEPGGATPLGEALQDTYNFNKTYLINNPEAAQCSANFVLVVTDGYPSNDDSWNRISGVTTFGKCTSGTGNYTCGVNPYGDSDVWPDSAGSLNNYMDDVAHWMYHKAPYKHTVHSIAFGLDNPMLGDVADSSKDVADPTKGGIYITAYNEEQLMNAFYSLGLSMTNAISFAAPAISVDEENRAQAGDELYMAFFRPLRNDYWQGNLKRFRISWNATQEIIYDQNNNTVTNSDGTFISSSKSFWSNEIDGGQINKGGAGGVLQSRVVSNFSDTDQYKREIWTHKDGLMTKFDKDQMNSTDLDVTNSTEVIKIINFIHGYTFDADASGKPKAVRNWVLGDIIHSEPVVIDYVDSTPKRGLEERYIAIGSNHGILHVFDTATGEELFGFIPPTLLPSLKFFAQISDTHYYGVDGQIAKFQTGRNPELLVFGLRRGGRVYYAFNVSDPDTSNWDLEWSISNETPGFSELGQTWSKVYFSNLPQTDNSTLDVGVFTGGYDPAEDTNSTSFLPGGNTMGRGLFVVNATDGSLVFKCTWGDTNSTSDPTGYTHTDMKYSFPADPRVIRLPDGHKDGDLVIYAVDVSGQLWKFLYDKDLSPQWQVYRIFNSNGPTNAEGGANVASGLSDKLDSDGALNSADKGRKCFSQPDISYAGDCSTDNPVIYFGTGDREHPLDITVSHRFYAVYDMSTNNTNSTYYNIVLDEADLLNVSDVATNSSTATLKLGDDYLTKAQGWYIRFDQQNDASNHTGEKLTSSPRLFNKIIYFSTYKPTFDDVCAPNGDSFLYAIKYCSGMPAYGWVDSLGKPTRYQLHKNSPLASSWRIMANQGVAAGKISVGSKLINIPIEIPSGLNLIWWDYN